MSLGSDWPTVDPGRFRHQITLLEQVAGSDASGAKVDYKADDIPVTAWADFEYLRGTDIIKAGQDISQVYAKVTMWFRPEFTANKRIQTSDGAQFVIQAVENVRRMNMYAVLMCLGIGPNN
jgi:SPP1 family predicted phage head-tail adaptor